MLFGLKSLHLILNLPEYIYDNVHPKLKINNLTNLQDARSSSAVGFDLISFSLERGETKKLSASLIWNMVNWLSGPEIILEMNVASLEELPQVENMFKHRYITIPFSEWNELLFEHADSIILRAEANIDPAIIKELTSLAEEEEKELKFEISISNIADAASFNDVSQDIFFHFSEIDLLEEFIKTSSESALWFCFRRRGRRRARCFEL